MKQILLISIVFIVGIFSAKGQSFEARLISGIGISSANFSSELEWIPRENHLHMTSVGADINYYLASAKMIGIYFGTGLRYKRNTYQYKLLSDFYNYNIRNINFNQQHLVIPLRVGLEWKLMGRNSIGLEYELQFNQAIKAESVNESLENSYAINRSLEYQYSLKSNSNNFVSHQFAIFLKTQIGKDIFVFTSLGYEWRPLSGDFDFISFQMQTLTDVDTGEQQSRASSHEINKSDIEHNLINFKLGVAKTF